MKLKCSGSSDGRAGFRPRFPPVERPFSYAASWNRIGHELFLLTYYRFLQSAGLAFFPSRLNPAAGRGIMQTSTSAGLTQTTMRQVFRHRFCGYRDDHLV